MLLHRARRNRKSIAIREMVKETHLLPSNLILPLFILDHEGEREPISSLPGAFRHNTYSLLQTIEEALSLGILGVILFPVIDMEKKDPLGSEALNPNNTIYKAIALIKQRFPELCIMMDIALDPFTSHGHDGVLNAEGDVENDLTVQKLCAMSLLAAQFGVDMVAPSDMMDGRVGKIRNALDEGGYYNVSIHAYCAKYASCFYFPFREALGTSCVGNKKSYQMDPANQLEALREAFMDENEGADLLMIKPAIHYLDVISKIREQSKLPISAYHVSGEYAQLHAAAQRGWVDFDQALWETAICIKRAGANLIVTYGAIELAKQIHRNTGSPTPFSLN